MTIVSKLINNVKGGRGAALLAALGAASVLAAGCGGSGDGTAGPAGNGPVPPTVGPGGVQLSTGGAQGETVKPVAGRSVTLTKAERAARQGEDVKKTAGFDPQPNVAKVHAVTAHVRKTSSRPQRAVGEHVAATNESRHKKTPGAIAVAAKKAAGGAANSPCRLVTKAEAAVIMKGSVKQTLAPQGPTCIYKSGKRPMVTMSVQSVRLASLLKTSRVVSKTRVGRHTVYCLKYGGTQTFVPLSAGRALNVTGACATGARFARKALSRI
jgi:hypothetical protein